MVNIVDFVQNIKVTSQASQHDLPNAHEIGETQVKVFLEEQLAKKTVDFFGPIPNNKLHIVDPVTHKKGKSNSRQSQKL